MTTLAARSTWADLAADLRARDHDPAYVAAPVLDVYGRISKDPETGETEKVDRQLVDTLVEVGRRHARLGQVLRDDGKSAWSPQARRPGWEALVARLEDGHAAGVICWHTDRLMRQPRDLERLVDLGDRGVLVASCHGDYDLSKADARFTLRVLTAAAAKESDSTSRRQKRKAQALRDAGRRFGGPRGFGAAGISPTGEAVPAALVAAEREAVAWAVRAHLDGVSLQAVAIEWNSRGLLTTHGLPWDPRPVGVVLRSGRIAGLLEHYGEIVGRLAGVEPIVSEEDREAVLALFASRRRGRPASERYLLSGGLLVCGRCRQWLTGKSQQTSGRPTRRNYVCRPRGGGCGRLTILADRVEAEVRAMVVRILSDPAHSQQIARSSAKLAAVEDKIAKADATSTELARRLGEGRLTLDRYDAAMAPLETRLARLAEEKEALITAGASTATQRASAEEVAAHWDDVDTTVEGRRAMVRRAAPRGIAVLPATPAQHAKNRPVAGRLVTL
jgi:site-specific DNA recombinase